MHQTLDCLGSFVLQADSLKFPLIYFTHSKCFTESTNTRILEDRKCENFTKSPSPICLISKGLVIRDFPDNAAFRQKDAKLACADKLGVFLSLTLCNKANFDLLQ